jgi:hypothetical protein
MNSNEPVRTVCGLTLTVFALCIMQSHAQAGLVIGTFDSTRATTANVLTGNYTHEAIASLTSHFPGTTFATAPMLTPQFLSGINILLIASPMTDSTEITPLSSSEQTAMLNFVKAGGSAFIIAEGYSPFIPTDTSMVSPFGMSIVDDGLTGILTATPTTQSHPVINGPFGDTTTIPLYGAGVFPLLGPYATSLAYEDATHKSVLAAIPSGALSPTSGRVVIISDSNVFIDDTQGGFFPQGQPLFLNTINYLATPEPSAIVLAGVGGAIVALGSIVRRRKRHRA